MKTTLVPLRGRRAAIAIAAVGLLAAGVVGARAAAPDATGTITACVAADGSPTIIDTEAGAGCADGEQQVSWGAGWRVRGAYDPAQEYAVGDIITTIPCGYFAGLRYSKSDLHTWVKTKPGTNASCLEFTQAQGTPDSGFTLLVPAGAPARPPATQNWTDGFRVGLHDDRRQQYVYTGINQQQLVVTYNYGYGVYVNMKNIGSCRFTATPIVPNTSNMPQVTATMAEIDEETIYFSTKSEGRSIRVKLDVVVTCRTA